jgi:hypothetical protein
MRAASRTAIVAGAIILGGAHAAVAQDKLVYADFETVDNGRALSARGGDIHLTKYQESDMHQTTTKGAPSATNSPELVRVKPDDPNRLGKFEFAIMAPNQYAGAGMEIKGQKDVDGKPQAEDLSAYKKVSFQLYATGTDVVRVEAVSRGQGQDLLAYPQMSFKVRPGLNTYEVSLKALALPRWLDVKVETKKILQKMTALQITAYCDQQCRPSQGMMIVDNVVFEK